MTEYLESTKIKKRNKLKFEAIFFLINKKINEREGKMIISKREVKIKAYIESQKIYEIKTKLEMSSFLKIYIIYNLNYFLQKIVNCFNIKLLLLLLSMLRKLYHKIYEL